MTAFMKMGDLPQAVREYERCRQALRTMLDLPPSKETVALYEAIRLMASSRAVAAQQKRPQAAAEAGGGAPPGASFAATPAAPAVPRPLPQPSIAVLPFRHPSAERD